MKGVRLLVVDDSEDILLVLKMELEYLGCAVDVARDATNALEAARRARPDVIITDIGLPDIDGFEFAKRVRQIPELAFTPIVALTGFDCEQKEELEPALAHAFNAHITKPAEPAALAALIQRLVSEKRATAG